jgi:serine/threonine protein kinase
MVAIEQEMLMADRVGQHIDDYRLFRLLGTGSFGEVYLGEHLEDQTPAAVKMLSLRA